LLKVCVEAALRSIVLGNSKLLSFLNGACDRSHKEDIIIDSNILAQFPFGTKLLSESRFGASEWAVTTARINFRLPGSSKEHYFANFALGNHGGMLLEGEYNAMSEMCKWIPNLVPRPHSWGRCATPMSETHFYLSIFMAMDNNLPDPEQLCEKLARFHRDRILPNGHYGFHVTTY
jgi:hypothetical protein